MSKAETNNMIKRIVDAAMTVLLLCLMAYQVTGEMAHEWIGMVMSSYAVPFLYGIAPVSFVRRMHLSISHWAFVLMGSPESENWRIDDETQHEVSVGSFYIDSYETTQKEEIRRSV